MFLDALKSFMNWILVFLKDTVDPLLMPVAERVPDVAGGFQFLVEFVAYINAWVAIDYAALCFLGWLGFTLAFNAFKLLRKIFLP